MTLFDKLSRMENELRSPLTASMRRSGFSDKGLESLKRFYEPPPKSEVFVNYITMFRPAGGLEYHLIKLNRYKKFPATLHEQYVFYPSECEQHALLAMQTLHPSIHYNGNVAFLLQFKVSKRYLTTQNVRQFGDNKQYWIPEYGMKQLNVNILGRIGIAKSFNLKIDKERGKYNGK